MATAQKLPEASSLSTAMATNYTTCKTDGAISGQFPAGLRVLVVDDDLACLRILEQMLRKCLYTVTTCSRATTALSLLREKKGGFDIVISDVHMPDMDGFKLLEHVGLEMDLPVIMMSADGRTSVVMRGIKHGACDYLIKPVRMEELKNIWQHVIRKKWNECKELEHSGSVEDTDRHRQVGDDTEYASSVKEGTDGNWKVQKKRRDVQEDDGELDSEDPSATKKPRVVWSVELHQQFVSAVNQLGIDKAVPKRILELMNVPGLTRENVASHLQKFRLYLKRLSGEAQRQDATIGSFCGPVESNAKLSSLVRRDLQAMAASGQISPQTLAILHDEFLGRPTGSLMLAGMDQPVLVQPSPQGSKCIPVEHGLAFGQPILKCHSSVSKQFHQPTVSIGDNTSVFPTWQRNQHGMPCFIGNMGGLNMQNSNRFMQTLNPSKQQPSSLLESSHAINVQPSCLIAPSESANSFQPGKNTVLTNQRSSFNSSTVVDFSPLPSQSNNISLGVQQVSDRDFKDVGVLNGCSVPDVSITSSMCSGLIGSESSTCWQVLNAGMGINSSSRVAGSMPNVCEIPASHSTRTTVLPEQGQGRNLGFVGKGTCIPSRFAVDDIESATGDLSHVKTCSSYDGERVKHELGMDFTENAKAGIQALQHFSPGDLMSVVSK